MNFATRGLGFLVGFGFSFMPNIAPLMALLFVLTTRWALRATDLIWWAAGALLALPFVVHGDLRAAAEIALELAAAWILYRAFVQLRARRVEGFHPPLVGAGLLAGFAVVVALGWFQIEAFAFGSAKTIAQAIVWNSHPALYGHTVLTLGSVIALVARGALLRLGALALAAGGILLSGSREAAIAWLLVATVLLLAGKDRSWRRRGVEALLVGVMAVVALGLSAQVNLGRIGFGVSADRPLASPNLLVGTEVAAGDWWDTSWVDIESGSATVGGERLTTYTVEKLGSEGWLRLQQAVTLEPGETYTVSAWLGTDELTTSPGIQGWGEVPSGAAQRDVSADAFIVTGSWREGAWSSNVGGEVDGRRVDAGIAAVDGPWQRVYTTFEYRGEVTLTWHVGLAPQVRSGPGRATFAGFQFERGELEPYAPGPATRGLDFRLSRLPLWGAAWRGFVERPWLGWGNGEFATYYTDTLPGRNPLHAAPDHPHDIYLHVAFERGIVGLVGLALLFTALTGSALRRRDGAALAVVAAVAIANLFDSTLFYGGVLYPLVAVLGWRAGEALPRHAPDRWSQQATARLGLAAGDFFAAWGALWAAFAVHGWLGFGDGGSIGTVTRYALLLWPAMAWREGLYPGYGLTAPQELRRGVSASATATVLLAAGVLIFERYLALPATALPLLLVFGAVAVPLARSVVKRTLHLAELWGRPVVVLGAGRTGQRVVRALRATQLDGLHPVAFFDDDPTLRAKRIGGLRVHGTLAEADAFAARHAIDHAIVAIPSLPQERLARLIDLKGRRFRYVQFVPSLSGLPAEDVIASNLDGMLAIEVRNGLHSRRNRAFKRAIDLLGAGIGTLLLSPLLLALWIWVRLDSPGPGFHLSPRVGQNGERFRCVKFRTMYADAEARLEQLMTSDPAVRDEYERWHKLEHDPRVTRVGRVLRRLSLDELPQLVNVLLGQMSLVGPRPYLTRELPKMGERADLILAAKPGITGYWQVTGRNDVTFYDRLAMEAHYVRNWSVWWDVILLVRTPVAVVARRGAR